jgi:ELWxxDGT repeat protein
LFTPGFFPSFTILGGKVLFAGADSNGNENLWVTDGTASGTSELSVTGTGSLFNKGYLPSFTVLGGKALFATDVQTELWVTDGTAAGTSELSVAGGGPLYPSGLTVFGSEVLFEGIDANGLDVAWVTDGTAAGTSELLLVAPPATVTSVTPSQASGVVGAGQTITITVGLSGPVRVSGDTSALSLTLNDGGTAFYDAAASAALGDPSKLVFDYTVGSSIHEYNVAELAVQGGNLGGATILNAAANVPDFSGLATVFPNLEVIVAPPATVTSLVASPASGVEGIGQAITFTLTMSKAVTVAGGTPELFLNDGGTATYDAAATAALGNPTKLVFDYTVGANDRSVSALAVVGGSYNGATITDAAGVAPDFSNELTTFANLEVVVAPPATVTSVVASPSSGVAGVGHAITLTLTMSKAVTVSGGTPELFLNDGGTATYDAAATAALNDPTKLVFDYTVGGNDKSVSALAVVGGSYNGATIRDAGGAVPDFSNDLTTFPNLGVVVPPTATVTSVVASPSTGSEGVGQTITLTLAMSGAVTVSGGTPQLYLNNGARATYDAAATAALGDPTKLVFDYTVALSDRSVAALAVIGGSYNGATIQDADGGTPDFSNEVTTFPNLAVVVPLAAVTSVVTSPSSGTIGLGEAITITLAMSRAVTVSGGTPYLALNDGGTATYDAAATAALADPTKLVFDYTVGAADEFSGAAFGSYQPTVPALAIVGGSFNGATIEDAAGTIPDFSGSLKSLPLQVVDAPAVTSVVATQPGGEVLQGSLLGIDLHTSEAVNVTGTPALLLNDAATVSYDAGLSTATDLFFIYRAGPEITTDLRISGIQSTTGGQITAAHGGDANLSGAGADLGLQVNTTSTGPAGPSSGNLSVGGGLELFGPSTAAVSFAGSTGLLKLDDSQGFAGTVAGFASTTTIQPSGTEIDFADIAFGANTTLGYTPNAADTGGMLTVSDGTAAANILLFGNYTAASFVKFDDSTGHTAVQNPSILGL